MATTATCSPWRPAQASSESRYSLKWIRLGKPVRPSWRAMWAMRCSVLRRSVMSSNVVTQPPSGMGRCEIDRVRLAKKSETITPPPGCEMMARWREWKVSSVSSSGVLPSRSSTTAESRARKLMPGCSEAGSRLYISLKRLLDRISFSLRSNRQRPCDMWLSAMSRLFETARIWSRAAFCALMSRVTLAKPSRVPWSSCSGVMTV